MIFLPRSVHWIRKTTFGGRISGRGSRRRRRERAIFFPCHNLRKTPPEKIDPTAGPMMKHLLRNRFPARHFLPTFYPPTFFLPNFSTQLSHSPIHPAALSSLFTISLSTLRMYERVCLFIWPHFSRLTVAALWRRRCLSSLNYFFFFFLGTFKLNTRPRSRVLILCSKLQKFFYLGSWDIQNEARFCLWHCLQNKLSKLGILKERRKVYNTLSGARRAVSSCCS